MTKNLNKADKTLLCAATLFLFFLALHLEYKDSVFAEGLLFVAEAALVGGVADWFAVTALFKKPLGFPYHTALLPKKRKELIDATTLMVEQEFFSRKKIIAHLKNFEVYSVVLDLLKSDEVKDGILRRIILEIKKSKERGKDFAIRYLTENLPNIFLKVLNDLKANGTDREALKKISHYLAETSKGDNVKEVIYEAFKDFEAKTVENELNFFLNMAAKSFGVVDLEEGTKIFQDKLANFFEELANNDQMQDSVLDIVHEKANKFLTDNEYANVRTEWTNAIFDALSVDKIVDGILKNALKNEVPVAIYGEYDKMVDLIETEPHIHNIFEHLIYDVVARSALYAQGKMGEIVSDAISALTDDELNRIVYEKAEEDLLWIRMNGSIVGGAVGLILFLCITLAR